jgi:plasmid stability protein
MALLVARDRELLKSGKLEDEARKANDLAASALEKLGLDPKRFGVSPPDATVETVPDDDTDSVSSEHGAP